MKKLILTSLIVLGAFISCTPKEGSTTPEATPDPAANNATATPEAPAKGGEVTPPEGGEAEGK